MAELEAPFKWFTKEQEVATMGLSIINICRLYRDYRQHWSLLVKLLSWLTPLGNTADFILMRYRTYCDKGVGSRE